MPQLIWMHADAPAKPAVGAPCNGCGVCCSSVPCPAGMLIGGNRHGPCAALIYAQDAGRYSCGLVTEPTRWLPPALHGAGPWVSRLARRWISAGSGCDSDVEVHRA